MERNPLSTQTPAATSSPPSSPTTFSTAQFLARQSTRARNLRRRLRIIGRRSVVVGVAVAAVGGVVGAPLVTTLGILALAAGAYAECTGQIGAW
ncbi:hypothetical protein Mal64_12360 [Pseudobythopirellula maris]|uniref:Uncharacterized protein n=1 Tax=Pseudobythopirellula maris TaxID=2527991 RepID=A0A5C5ZTT1_9BACT|nr:hypothetical protein [Pseudobythopirellula maris]TWT90839.1 hypothetical protein Mal64_12360 [Pseudobythopirellula maris]